MLIPDDLDKQLEELLAAGRFTVTGEQPQPFPGFVQQGDPEAPYFTPDPSFRPPLAQGEAVPITSFGPDDVPITPQVQVQMEGKRQQEEVQQNLEDSTDPFAIAAARTRRGVMPELGRQEDNALGKVGGGIAAAYKVLDDLAKGGFVESEKAAAGEEFDPRAATEAAQLALPGKGALLLAGGLAASGMASKKLQESPYSPADLAQLLVPSAGAAEMTDKEKLQAAGRARLAPNQQVPTQPAPGTAPPVGLKTPHKPREPVQGSKESDDKFFERQRKYEKALEQYEVDKKTFYSTFTPTAQKIISTVGGPKVVKEADYTGLGTLAAVSAGMILAPRVLRAFKWGTTPRPRGFMDALLLREGVFGEQKIPTGRIVQNAMPGTKAFSTPLDLARSADSINQSILRIGAKNGLTPTTQRHLENLAGTYTRGGARHLTESAVETGRMETNTFSFNAPVSLSEMQRKFTPEMKQYIAALDTFEALVAQSRLNAYKVSKGNPNPGLPTMAGYDVNTLGPLIGQMERGPNGQILKDAAKAWNGWNKSVRDFQVKGEYATIPKYQANPMVPDNSQQYLNQHRKYETPWLEGKVNYDKPLGERIAQQDPIQMQSMYSKVHLKDRLENEFIGQYVDSMRKTLPESFVKIDPAMLRRNPELEKTAVHFYRRGVKESYSTDPFIADALKMDMPVMANGDIFYAAKRGLEFGATGPGAPFFASTQFVRNYWIGKMSAEKGFYSPTIAGSIRAIGQQLYPETAKAIHQAIDGGALSRFAGVGWVDSLSKTLAKHYNDSLYFQLKKAGTVRGSMQEHERTSAGIQELARMIKEHSGPAKPFLNGWKNLFESIANGPAFDYARRNLNTINPRTGQQITLPDLAQKARALTGDPRVAGQYYFKEAGAGPNAKQRMIRYEHGPDGLSRVGHAAADYALRPYLYLSEFGRKAVPWFNPTQQGIKGIGQAYLRDPVQFTRNMWLYAAMPEAALYLYTHSLGKDPNGHSYIDYKMNRRSAYNRQMSFYVPLPWLPAEDGLEIPFFHELAPVKRMVEIGMDHMFGNADNTLKEDYWKAAHAFVKTAVIPPIPPPFAAVGALAGFQFPQGVFGEQGYTIKSDPFDQYRGMPANIEAFTRALGGGMAQVVGSGYAAFTNTPEGFTQGIMNGLSQGGKTAIEKAPVVRDMTRILPVMSGNTDIREELFEKQKEIDQLLRFYQGDKAEFQINTKAASQGGGNAADAYGAPTTNTQPPGLVPPDPNNPLYLKFMGDVYNRFKKEAPTYVKGVDEGGIGFRSLWRRYGDATQALKTLRSVNDGNNVTWQKQLEGRPELRKELEASNVDPTDLRAVKNYYVYKQQDSARIILKTIKAVEQEFSAKIGKPVTIKDFVPYVTPEQAAETEFAYPELVQEAQTLWNNPATPPGTVPPPQ